MNGRYGADDEIFATLFLGGNAVELAGFEDGPLLG